MQLEYLLGVKPKHLSPLIAIGKLKKPVLLIYGSDDQRTRIDEGRMMYEAAMGPKKFWEVSGARHLDLYQFNKAEYEQHVSSFLEEWIKRVE